MLNFEDHHHPTKRMMCMLISKAAKPIIDKVFEENG